MNDQQNREFSDALHSCAREMQEMAKQFTSLATATDPKQQAIGLSLTIKDVEETPGRIVEFLEDKIPDNILELLKQ